MSGRVDNKKAEHRSRVDGPGLLSYMVQSLLAAVFVGLSLILLRNLAGLMVSASLGSSSFLVFARPGSVESRPGQILKGYGLSLLCGVSAALVAGRVFPDSPTGVALVAAVAVGAGMLLMSLSGSKHSPALGSTLAITFGYSNMSEVVLFVAGGAVIMAAANKLLRKRLRNLT